MSPASAGKGYFVLKNALDRLWESKSRQFSLNVFFELEEIPSYMNTHGRYDYSDLEKIFDETDVLVAPSIWYETFGYTVLEALSYGVPVIVSDHVGAKDIIPDKCGIIIENMDEEKLYENLKFKSNVDLDDEDIHNVACFLGDKRNGISAVCGRRDDNGTGY